MNGYRQLNESSITGRFSDRLRFKPLDDFLNRDEITILVALSQFNYYGTSLTMDLVRQMCLEGEFYGFYDDMGFHT